MTKNIAHLTGNHEGAVAKFIRQAEELCGYPSEDARLIAETSQKLKDKISQLGLDPQDTTNQELYWALRSKADKDSQIFSKLCGLDSLESSDRLVEIFQHIQAKSRVYALKKSAGKNLLRELPPKQLMKKLGYRSAESMLKREDINGLFSVVFLVESLLWRQKFSRLLKKLTANEFEERDLEIVKLNSKLEPLGQKDINTCYLMGVVSISPNKIVLANQPGLSSSLRLLEAANKIKAWSLSVSTKRLSSTFGNFVSTNATKEPKQAALFYDTPVEFGALQGEKTNHLAKLADLSLPLAWWKDNQSLANIGKKKPVSLNLLDILNDYSRQANFADRQTSKFQRAFWQELLGRYLKYPAFRSEVLKDLEPEPVIAEDTFDATSLQRFLEAV